MAALVLPVVVGGMDHTEVRCPGMVEELGNLLEGMGIGVLVAARVTMSELVGERRELRRGPVREGVAALDHQRVETAGLVSPGPAPCGVGKIPCCLHGPPAGPGSAAPTTDLGIPVRTFQPKPADIERAWHV